MSKFRKIDLFLLILLLVLTPVVGYADAGETELPANLDDFPMRILHNGKYLEAKVEGKILENGVVLAPLRLLLEKAGYKVDWNPNGMVTIKKDGQVSNFNSKKPGYQMEKIRGNILVDLEFFKQFKDLSLAYDNVAKTIIFKTANLKDDEVFYYDLGTRTMEADLVGDLEYRLNGGIALPKTDKNPLVMILHGSHHFDKSEFNRYDLGYSYLLRDLRDQGYAAMSLNVGINYSFENGEPFESERLDHIFEESLKELERANQGEENNFGLDLKNKIDLDNVILLGHSRSGQEIYRLADKYKDDNRLKIKGLLSLAPARLYEMDYSTVDLPTAIILPQLDGDVYGLDGHWIFDNLMDLEDRTAESQMVYLYGANHNAFNQAILNQDEGDFWQEGDKFILDPEKQRDFLKTYTRKFIATVLEGESLHKNIKNQGESLFGYQALVSSFIPGDRVYTADQGLDNIRLDGALAEKKVYSNMMGDGNTTGFYPPGDSNALNLLNIRWTEKNTSIAFDLDKKIQGRDRLVLYLAQDSSDDLNKKENQRFTVTLVDKSGQDYSVKTKKDHHVLRYQKGKIMDDLFYTTHTPLGFLEIPLDDFKGLDKDSIETIRLDFTEKDTGSLMLRHIQFN